MDIISTIIGFVVGASISGVIVWRVCTANAKAKSQHLQSTENEIKQLISQQAQQHIMTTKSAVETMQAQLVSIQEQLAGFESGLKAQQHVNTDETFYGEHASLFLRNLKQKKAPKDSIVGVDNPPRDFSAQSSGVFAGNIEQTENNSR